MYRLGSGGRTEELEPSVANPEEDPGFCGIAFLDHRPVLAVGGLVAVDRVDATGTDNVLSIYC